MWYFEGICCDTVGYITHMDRVIKFQLVIKVRFSSEAIWSFVHAVKFGSYNDHGYNTFTC